MDQRLQFVTAVLAGGQFSFTELCERTHISRKTGYKWLWCFWDHPEDEKVALVEQSRAPHTHPNETDPAVVQLLLEARQKHPDWGARKLLTMMGNRGIENLPAPSTATEILRRHELVRVRPRRRPRPPTERARTISAAPNDVWTADFKGQFRTGDGVECFPLTLVDDFSRFLLALRGLPSTRQKGVFEVMERAFREYGLPTVIRTDNGVPFATTALAHLSKLSVWWIKLGIRVERITPGTPTENARHERLHRTLKECCIIPYPAPNARAQQRRFDEFRLEYNTVRPHEGLEMATPASLYKPSPRPFPDEISVSYPAYYEVRKVGGNGAIRWHTATIFLSDALIGEFVGLHEVSDGLWSVQFADVELGRWHQRQQRLYTGGAMGPRRLNAQE